MDWINAVCILCTTTMHHGLQTKACAWIIMGLFVDVDVGGGIVLLVCCNAAHDAGAFASQLRHQFYDAHDYNLVQNHGKQVEHLAKYVTITT